MMRDVFCVKVRFSNGVCLLAFDAKNQIIGEPDAGLLQLRDKWERHVGRIDNWYVTKKPLSLKDAAQYMAGILEHGGPLPMDSRQRAAGERDEGRADA